MSRTLLPGALPAGAALLLSVSVPARASVTGSAGAGAPALAMFFLFIALTLYITWRASRFASSRAQFYSAEGKIKPWQNGMAMAGDFVSAASFFGISGLVFMSGYDGLVYSVGFLAGWPVLLFLVAERLRNLGRFTAGDAIAFRLQKSGTRVLTACCSLAVVAFYLIGQIVGSGKLIEVLFGLPYAFSVTLVGVLMMLYVIFGGMLATTWVQIIKAILLLSGATILAFIIFRASGFSFERLFSEAVRLHPKGREILNPGGMLRDPVSAVSLGIALIFGTAGLPHILMRFFTVRDARAARRSVFFATGFIGYFYLLTFVIGFGAIVFLLSEEASTAGAGALSLPGGSNMAAVHLAGALGGDLFLGFICAVAFATILAVVAGLTLAGASCVSHDLYAHVWRRNKPVTEAQEIRVTRLATAGIGIVTILLGLTFEHQNVAYMTGLAFAVAASTNFPLLVLSMYWKRLTTKGALYGGRAGLISVLVMVILGPAIWVNVLGFAQPVFPWAYPAIFSVPLAFVTAVVFSLTDRSAQAEDERALFAGQNVYATLGMPER